MPNNQNNMHNMPGMMNSGNVQNSSGSKTQYGSNALYNVQQLQQKYQNNSPAQTILNNSNVQNALDYNNVLSLDKAIERKQQILNQSVSGTVNSKGPVGTVNSARKQNKDFLYNLIENIVDSIFPKKNKENVSENRKEIDTPKIVYKSVSEQEVTTIEILDDNRDLLYREDISVQDKIAPSSLEVDFNDIKINDTYVRTIVVVDYKKAYPGFLESIINYDEAIDVCMYYYPIDTQMIIDLIRRKITDLEVQLNMDLEAGRVPNPYAKVALQDALRQQEELASGAEKYFHFALYITIKANSISDLNYLTSTIISDLKSKEMSVKIPTLKMENAFKSTLPYGYDRLKETRNMDTSSIAMTFPFTSSDLSQEKGILYGINTYNQGLIIFDRFSMPNANMVVLATSGGGKSYFVKLEIIRSLMLGTECIVIDPENEYQLLTETLGGAYISFSQDGTHKLNPFELPFGVDSGEDELRLKELSLQGFFKILFGGLSTDEVTILDKAIRFAYREKGITQDPATFVNEPPRLEDLYKVLRAMDDYSAIAMASKLERFLIGSAAGIFDRKTNIDLNKPLTVFSIRDLSEELRPLAMYLMLDYIWTIVKRQKKRRILAIDEAWILMKYPDSALFINSVAKRARKYYLGLTTISQEVNDFLSTDYGRTVITNSSIQVLLRQTKTSVSALAGVFDLTEGEMSYLQSVPPGYGLFFAGQNHVSIAVKASPIEHMLVTSNPVELEKLRKLGFIK